MAQGVEQLFERTHQLFERGSQDTLWQTVAEQFYPERAEFTVDRAEGVETSSHLFDGSPVVFRRDLGNAFGSMLRPRGQPWMSASVADIEQYDEQTRLEAKRFLEHVTQVVRSHLYRAPSQFVRATKEADHDYAAFGAAVISAEINQTRAGLIYRNHHLKDCAWAENHQGEVDTLHRKIWYTPRQYLQKFNAPTDYIHRTITEAADQKSTTKFEIRHLMMPVDEHTFTTRKPPKDAKFASVYVDMGNKCIIREAGSYEFRYVVPRWQTISGSVYPVSPAAMTALPDARMLQRMAQIMLEAAEKQIDPPVTAVEGGVIGDVNLYPGGTTWIDNQYDWRTGVPVAPIELAKNVRLGVDLLMRTTAQLNDAWYLSKLNLPERGERTAYEMARRVEEYIRAAVPLFEPLESSYNAPLLDLTAEILVRVRGFNFDLMPEALALKDLEWMFDNPLQDALEKRKIFAAQQNLELIQGHLAVTGDRKLLADYDTRQSLRDSILATGGPATWVRDKDEADEAVAQAEEEDKMRSAMAQAQMGGEAATAVGEGATAVREGLADVAG